MGATGACKPRRPLKRRLSASFTTEVQCKETRRQGEIRHFGANRATPFDRALRIRQLGMVALVLLGQLSWSPDLNRIGATSECETIE